MLLTRAILLCLSHLALACSGGEGVNGGKAVASLNQAGVGVDTTPKEIRLEADLGALICTGTGTSENSLLAVIALSKLIREEGIASCRLLAVGCTDEGELTPVVSRSVVTQRLYGNLDSAGRSVAAAMALNGEITPIEFFRIIEPEVLIATISGNGSFQPLEGLSQILRERVTELAEFDEFLTGNAPSLSEQMNELQDQQLNERDRAALNETRRIELLVSTSWARDYLNHAGDLLRVEANDFSERGEVPHRLQPIVQALLNRCIDSGIMNERSIRPVREFVWLLKEMPLSEAKWLGEIERLAHERLSFVLLKKTKDAAESTTSYFSVSRERGEEYKVGEVRLGDVASRLLTPKERVIPTDVGFESLLVAELNFRTMCTEVAECLEFPLHRRTHFLEKLRLQVRQTSSELSRWWRHDDESVLVHDLRFEDGILDVSSLPSISFRLTLEAGEVVWARIRLIPGMHVERMQTDEMLDLLLRGVASSKQSAAQGRWIRASLNSEVRFGGSRKELFD